MQLSITLKRAIQSAILILMLLSIVLVWPMKLFRPWQYTGETDKNATSIILNESTIMQGFIPEKPGLSNVSFYIYNEDEPEYAEGMLDFRVFNENLQKMDEKSFRISDLKLPGMLTVKFRDALVPGKTYYFSIENPGNSLLFSMSDGMNLDARYGYHTFFTKGQYALYGLAVFLVGSLLVILCEILLKKNRRIVKLDFGFRLALSALVLISALWAAVNVFPGMKFTRNLTDIIFYEIGIVLFAALALFGLLYKRDLPANDIISYSELKMKIPGLLQTLAFAGVMAGCVNYVNALYTYQQQVARNQVLICFALAIIFGYSRKELLNWYNISYLIPTIGIGIYYLIQHDFDAEQFAVARGTVCYYILWGIVVMNTIRLLITHKWCKLFIPYTIAFVLLIAEMVRSRNTRIWPIYIAVFFGMFLIRVMAKGGVSQYLERFSNGVLIHFVYISFYAFLHRPFHFYLYIRYPGVFHTVTVTSVYLFFVLMLSIAKFLSAYREKGRLRFAMKELWLMGMATAFLLMTVSRTGFLSAVILCPLTFIVTAYAEFKDGLKGAMKRLAVFFIAGIGFFFILFTTCRIVPAVVEKPFTYDIEHFIDSIKPGEEWDSYRFATVRRFFGFADAKLTYYNSDTVLTHDEQSLGATTDYSNGRLDIYKAYLQALNWKGHDNLSLVSEDGEIMIHAHNSYLQAAYDFGLGAGIYFLLFCMFAGIRVILYYVRHLGERTNLIPATIVGAFGVCGVVERVFFPFIPLGFAFLFILTLMTISDKKGRNEKIN